jgi:hypothetical protein
MVYNLAVAFHMSAVNRSASTTNKKFFQRLRKAQSFYGSALQLKSDFEDGRTAASSVDVVAIANNQARIHRLLSEPVEAERCRQLMLHHIGNVFNNCNQHNIVQFEEFVTSAKGLSPTASAA